VPEMRSLQVRAHPQMILVMRWSIFRFVKMILSFRMSRVFSRTRVQARSQHISQFRGCIIYERTCGHQT